jgi:purine-binding chemotaxis protein CheW
MNTDMNPHADDLFDYDEDEDTLEGRILTFPIQDEEYGIEIRYVTDIVVIQKITEVPDMPSFVKGVINLRGRVIPVVDVRLRFGLPFREYDDHTCIIVINIDKIYVGLIVDTVSEVVRIPDENIDPPPALSKGKASRFIKGLGKIDDDVKIILDSQKLLFEEELDKISENVSGSES